MKKLRSPKTTRLSVCPCTIVQPCNYLCTCANEDFSGGCRRCATYGNKQQQKAKAEWLAKVIDAADPIAPINRFITSRNWETSEENK